MFWHFMRVERVTSPQAQAELRDTGVGQVYIYVTFAHKRTNDDDDDNICTQLHTTIAMFCFSTEAQTKVNKYDNNINNLT